MTATYGTIKRNIMSRSAEKMQGCTATRRQRLHDAEYIKKRGAAYRRPTSYPKYIQFDFKPRGAKLTARKENPVKRQTFAAQYAANNGP